jgi:hypothetical protein
MTLTAAQAASRKISPHQADAVRAEVTAILSSESFSSSKRCQEFLAFVVEHALAGDYESLTERFLGAELFGRAIDYETATDSIVRVRANDVRRRLAQYYSGQRSMRAVRIDLVAGGYVPEFHWRIEEKAEAVSRGEPAGSVSAILASELQAGTRSALRNEPEIQGSHRKGNGLWVRVVLWGGAVAVLAAVLIALSWHSRQSNLDRFWQPVLAGAAAAVRVRPTTDTLQLAMDPMRTLNPLKQLKPGETLNLRPGDVIGFHDWHISLPVLQATLSVALMLERKGKVPLVRVGTDMRRDEVRGHPIIAIGSFSNPWVEQNVSGLRFTFDRGASDRDPPRITDSFNRQRSWSLPRTYPDPQDKDYAIITRTFDPVTREPFVSLAGLHSFGNQIAGEFVVQDSSWNELARRAPKGWEKMNLQVLLEADVVGTTPGSPRIVDAYFWK